MTPAVTPEVTINNSAAEIKAAMEAVPVEAPVVTPEVPVVAEPAKAEWGQLAKTADGIYQVTLATGEVFKGTADEVIAKQGEAHVNTKRWAQEQKSRADAAVPATPVTPEVPVESAEEIATREWLVAQTAKAFGMTPDQYKAAVQNVFQTTEQAKQINVQQQLNSSWLDFVQACPDFVDTPETCSALVEYLPQDVVSGQRPPSSDEFKRAHASALYDKKYQPAQATQVLHTAIPPVMPSSGTSAGAGEINPWAMPMSELKKQIG